MKIKLKYIVENTEPIANLLKLELPVKTAYKLAKLSNTIQSELREFEQLRNNLIKKYGKQSGDEIKIEPTDKETFGKFSSEITELLETEIEINYTPINIDELGSIKLSAYDIGKLLPFFEQANENLK
ncbi:hypothetical protein [Ignavibacterium sp.]|uniref:hypothetical protein n=1 Tax=Ignavibacterium sp. TaxID=2651167 RepID=UPI00307EF42B